MNKRRDLAMDGINRRNHSNQDRAAYLVKLSKEFNPVFEE